MNDGRNKHGGYARMLGAIALCGLIIFLLFFAWQWWMEDAFHRSFLWYLGVSAAVFMIMAVALAVLGVGLVLVWPEGTLRERVRELGTDGRALWTWMFPSAQVRAVLRELDELEAAIGEPEVVMGAHLGLDIVKPEVRRTVLRYPGAVAECLREGESARAMVYRMIANCAWDHAVTGLYHVGLGYTGRALAQVVEECIAEQVRLGVYDQAEADEMLAEFRRRIRQAAGPWSM